MTRKVDLRGDSTTARKNDPGNTMWKYEYDCDYEDDKRRNTDAEKDRSISNSHGQMFKSLKWRDRLSQWE